MMVNIEEFILNASILITIIYLSAFLHKQFLVNLNNRMKVLIFITFSILAGWSSMFFGIHLGDAVIFDLRFIPIIIATLFAKKPWHIVVVGTGIGILRFTFGISEAAIVGFINMLLLSLTGLLMNKYLAQWSFVKKKIFVSIGLNVLNSFVIAMLGVFPLQDYLRSIIPIAMPMSITLSLFLSWMVKDLAEESASKKDLLEKASRDPLTKLYNRRAFMRFYEEYALEKEKCSPLAVSIIDIDFFKKVNDTHGHVTGDLVLQRMSELFTENLRSIDIIARYGGEEFVVLLPHCDQGAAEKAMERVRAAIEEETFLVNGLQLQVTVSIGVATSLNVEMEYLINAADKALYEAKNAGRNRVLSYKMDNIGSEQLMKKVQQKISALENNIPLNK
ncbi:diguanylate cyclase [Halobacillus sp. A1]|uniref:diguanylate cyclase n=1 Tax=Halobacillus sp. A1 TaxID=2880262 RepID=UPI0020A6BEEC|nr:diguanylate cyclase [Halobacillus sp. A1]MCP3030027.1 diguanylate cyclase [Halobacillus sp. A1]